jgi:hypothetical protein
MNAKLKKKKKWYCKFSVNSKFVNNLYYDYKNKLKTIKFFYLNSVILPISKIIIIIKLKYM